MRHLKTYKIFEAKTGLTPEQEEWLDECTDGTWKLNPQTGLVDVDGDFDCSEKGLSDFKGIRFGEVRGEWSRGNFYCENNQLTTLEGAPQQVRRNFYCKNNQLTTLEGSPQEVGGTFRCEDNQLTTLRGAPQEVRRNFYCKNNQLTTLEGAPQKIGGEFNCESNQLTSLEGGPQKVGLDFNCESNQLTTLEGAPQKVFRDFSCNNNKLTTLRGAPQEVRHFSCKNNQLTTLEGAPQKVELDFDCDNNQLITLEGAPQKVGWDFDCNNNKLTTLEGAPQNVRDFSCNNNKLTSLEGAPQKVGRDFSCNNNPVSGKTLKSIFGIMETGRGYLESVEYLWDEIPVEDQALLYRSEFEWVGIKGLLKILKAGSKKAQELILKFLSPEVLNVEIQKDTTGMIMKLKSAWNDESFRETRDKLVWPKGYEQEADLLGDLDDVGF